MNKELDLVKILAKVPKETKLYSLTDGEVTLTDIKCGNFPIVVIDKFKNIHYLTKEGKYRNTGVGECILYPSKECRDWNEFKIDLPEGTPVMVSSDKVDWSLRFYYKDKMAYNLGKRCGDTTPWGYIVPVHKFNCNNLTFNTEDNYGMVVD